MNRWLAIAFGAAAATLFSSSVAAQELIPLDASAARIVRSPANGTITPPSGAAHGAIVADFVRGRGVDAATASSLRDAGERSIGSNLVQLRMEQEVGGLSVYGTYVRATFSSRGELLHLIENIAPVSRAGVLTAQIAEGQALNAALRELYPAQAFNPVAVGRNGNTTSFAAGAFFYNNPTVTVVALPMTDNVLRAGFLVQTWSRDGNQLHHTVIGGDGRVLLVESRTSNDRYNVFTEDPSKGAQTIVSGPGSGNAESPIGWLGSGAQTTVNIAGNNTHTYLDSDANNAPDAGGAAVTDGDFLTAVDLGQQPSTASNKAVAVQQLFYLNNVIHDTLYRHGFNEAAGNFQSDNFGFGGLGNDAVNAEAQDGSGTDNANFATPADGSAPRMQMFLWTGAGPDSFVTVNSTDYGAHQSAFGPALTLAGVTGLLAEYVDGTAPTSDGCEASVTSLAGKIALVDRGTCNFTVKVLNAQKAGAVGVVIINNAPSGAFAPGGTERRIRIPSAMVTLADGSTLRTQAGASGRLRLNPVPPLMTDGDLDSDVVFHEYGHGLTWRMVGSMSGPIAGAIGEGAADVNAFLVNGDDRIGEYAFSNELGIRRAPYAGYPNTYSDVTGNEVHDDGEIYAAAMWRVLENYLAAGLLVSDVQADFVNGLNFTPPGPAFEDMRDGMLQSAGSVRECLVWRGFAATGIGVGAQAVVRGKRVTVTESFALPAQCTP
jgi:extracellular elastinolytic metalloproteinase